MNTPHSDSTHTSLAQLFSQPINGLQVQAIEIPLIQRDYAQGRNSPQVQQIRGRFITSLCDALDSPGGIDLDFVFGDVVVIEHGTQKVPTLYPLDGQQRLTTLFLLHCYLAWHTGETEGVRQPWHAFSYATRPSARAFCEFLTVCRPSMAQGPVSTWLKDQASYLPTWKHDPTIQGMLVMLDALHERYCKDSTEKLRAHWQRLTDPTHPAIRFHLLPIQSKSENNTLYVKMNSRGRPLTDFENFKAELEALMRDDPAIPAETKRTFSDKIDTIWADLFWHYRGDNHLIDEEFMRYLRFLAEVQAWKIGKKDVNQSQTDRQALAELAGCLLADMNWTVRALDIWAGIGPDSIKPLFEQLFTRTEGPATQPLRMFNFRDFNENRIGVDLFHACCESYGKSRPWSLPHTLLLYGVLRAHMEFVPLDTLRPRLRLLRNLIEASRVEIRTDNMPRLLAEVYGIVVGKTLAEIKTFNQVQVRNEQDKQALLDIHPTLRDTMHRLEDHVLLRGGLTAFNLDPAQNPATFEARALQFAILFNPPHTPYSLASVALLAKRNDGRGYMRSSGHRLTYLGAPRQQQAGLWEDHWRARRNEHPHPSSTALLALLDCMAAGQPPQSVVDAFLDDPQTPKDWRYYLAKYPAMRGEQLEFAGTYVVSPDPGYSLCMLYTDSCDNRSYHHDAYLLALATLAQVTPANDRWPRSFYGYEDKARYLELLGSRIKIRCVDAGWEFSNIPEDAVQQQAFNGVVQSHPRYQNLLYAIPQHNGIDTEDRIELGAQLLRDLIAVGM